MIIVAKLLTLCGMLATVAWFFWNPDGWTFDWEPIVVFLLSIAGYVATEFKGHKNDPKYSPHPNDAALFARFLLLLPSESVITFIREHHFLDTFDLKKLSPLEEFLCQWDNAAHEFQDETLDSLRKDVLERAREFSLDIATYTFPTSTGFQSVVGEGERLYRDPDSEVRWEKAAKRLNELAEKFAESHDALVREGRKRLDVSK